jgi:hypothetical protein
MLYATAGWQLVKRGYIGEVKFRMDICSLQPISGEDAAWKITVRWE